MHGGGEAPVGEVEELGLQGGGVEGGKICAGGGHLRPDPVGRLRLVVGERGLSARFSSRNSPGSYNIEKQSTDFYTREVFSKFQKLLTKSTGFGLQHQVQGDSIIFHLVANDGVNQKVYVVRVDPEYERLERWSKRTTDVAPDPSDGHRAMHFGVPTTNTLKFNSLCRNFGKLASDACFSDEAYNFMSGLINQGIVGVAAMKARARDGVPGAGEAQGHESDQQVHVSTGPVTGQQEPAPIDEDHNAKSCKLLADMLAASAATKVPGVETVLAL
ncbi:Protein FAR1-RELATED SEQUENCE 3 [Hordeum vulgare]|nr:Protein FAR1-RELATED SEQUENCE 3 [Hordeum vulgare]